MPKDHHGAKFLGIWAGIVSYNPDIERLRENVATIAPQVDRLLIFDNGSKNAEEVEKAFGSFARIIRSAENLGMAKALNQLCSAAEKGGATDIVLLDQDSVAADDLVAGEAMYRGEGVGLVCALTVDRNHKGQEFDRALLFDIKRPITSGSMVSIAAWSAVGGYDERLFVDWVDVEFCDNLRTHGYRLLRTYGTSILHELGHQEYAWNAPGGDDSGKAHASRAYYRQNYPAWRWRDRARSQTITIHKYGWSRIGWEERYFFLRATLGRILLLEGSKIECLKAVVAGCRSGRNAAKTKMSA